MCLHCEPRLHSERWSKDLTPDNCLCSAREHGQQYSRGEDLGYDPDDRNFVHPHEMPNYPTQNFYRKCVLTGFQIGSFIGTSLSFGLIVVMAIVWYIARRINPFHKQPPPPYVSKEFETRITGERFSNRAE